MRGKGSTVVVVVVMSHANAKALCYMDGHLISEIISKQIDFSDFITEGFR